MSQIENQVRELRAWAVDEGAERWLQLVPEFCMDKTETKKCAEWRDFREALSEQYKADMTDDREEGAWWSPPEHAVA